MQHVLADGGPSVIMGYPRTDGDRRFNSVAVLEDGRIIASRDKVDLPNYGEFDEKRVFHVGEMPGPVANAAIAIDIASTGIITAHTLLLPLVIPYSP